MYTYGESENKVKNANKYNIYSKSNIKASVAAATPKNQSNKND